MNTNIVDTNINYNSFILIHNLELLTKKFPFISTEIIGNSVIGQNLYVIKLGNGSKEVFYSASIHANEWITSTILMNFIEDYCNAFITNSNLYGYNIRNLFNSCTIYIMPMVNPDGVGLIFIGICYNCFNNFLNSTFSFIYSFIQFNLLNAK